MKTEPLLDSTGGPSPVESRPFTGVGLAVYLLLGVYFGIVMTKSEMIS